VGVRTHLGAPLWYDKGMAFVTEFFSNPGQGSSRRHSTCRAGWRIADRDGEPVLQLDTYGSEERQDKGTVSQSLQIDESGARDLIDLLHQAFPNLARR
jgi:hypothetical protein